MSTTTNTGETKTSNYDELALSNKQLMIIMAVVGAVIVIGTNASICTYWKMKTRPRGLQTSTIVLSDIETTTEDATQIPYYEIEDIPSYLNFDGPLMPHDLSTTDDNRKDAITAIEHYANCPQVQYENIASTSKTELSNVIQINTLEHQDNTVPKHAIDMQTTSQIPCKLSTEVITSKSKCSNTFRTAQEHGGFITLADINICHGAVSDSDGLADSLRHRTDAECSHYENLDPTAKDAGSQYTTLP